MQKYKSGYIKGKEGLWLQEGKESHSSNQSVLGRITRARTGSSGECVSKVNLQTYEKIYTTTLEGEEGL